MVPFGSLGMTERKRTIPDTYVVLARWYLVHFTVIHNVLCHSRAMPSSMHFVQILPNAPKFRQMPRHFVNWVHHNIVRTSCGSVMMSEAGRVHLKW